MFVLPSYVKLLPVASLFSALYLPTLVPCIPPSEDSCPEGSIDLKCKERVTDSDEDEPDGQVARMSRDSQPNQEVALSDFFDCSAVDVQKRNDNSQFLYFYSLFFDLCALQTRKQDLSRLSNRKIPLSAAEILSSV